MKKPRTKPLFRLPHWFAKRLCVSFVKTDEGVELLLLWPPLGISVGFEPADLKSIVHDIMSYLYDDDFWDVIETVLNDLVNGRSP